MNIIVIAAGTGKRLGIKTKDLPKYLIKVNEKTIMEYQQEMFEKIQYDKFVIITGPHKEKFTFTNAVYVEDINYQHHDILGSLMAARDYIFGDVLIVYSDIIFDYSILSKIIESDVDIGIAVDMNWEKNYENRTEHTTEEAENVLLDGDKVLEIRKHIINKNNIGEFLGIMKLSAKGSKIFVKKFLDLERFHKGSFQNAPSLHKGYLTDIIQELVNSKVNVKPIIVTGKWCEIDTNQDLEKASIMFK
ncbi:NTP transferase domain-containing protein [Nitrosopumilus sp.]|uniref:phosphocholine cytidylyltransferase family protein n=1 Tax=Nitrosopumilus sp. TaxID=2024843 RepID=UPI0034A04489